MIYTLQAILGKHASVGIASKAQFSNSDFDPLFLQRLKLNASKRLRGDWEVDRNYPNMHDGLFLFDWMGFD
jgi:hypothetical protein